MVSADLVGDAGEDLLKVCVGIRMVLAAVGTPDYDRMNIQFSVMSLQTDILINWKAISCDFQKFYAATRR